MHCSRPPIFISVDADTFMYIFHSPIYNKLFTVSINRYIYYSSICYLLYIVRVHRYKYRWTRIHKFMYFINQYIIYYSLFASTDINIGGREYINVYILFTNMLFITRIYKSIYFIHQYIIYYSQTASTDIHISEP